jgi:hypothetical protein
MQIPKRAGGGSSPTSLLLITTKPIVLKFIDLTNVDDVGSDLKELSNEVGLQFRQPFFV